jgi:hypothetical protein
MEEACVFQHGALIGPLLVMASCNAITGIVSKHGFSIVLPNNRC